MRHLVPFGLAVLAALVLFLGWPSGTARAQTGGSKGVDAAPTPSPARTPKPRPPTRKREVATAKRQQATIRTGSLLIATEPQAIVTFEMLGSAGNVVEDFDIEVPAGEGAVIRNGLKPGRYRITAELDGYNPAFEEVVLGPKKEIVVTLALNKIKYDYTLELNVDAGRVSYERGNEGARVVNIEPNRTARLSQLEPGRYTVRVEPDDRSFEPKQEVIEVSGTSLRSTIRLNNRETTVAFSPGSASGWALPAGWRWDSGILKTNGPGVAIPRDTTLRNYKDFQLVTNARMTNRTALSFAVRAQDAQNYYLIQLTGNRGDERFVLRGFVVRNGKAEPFGQVFPIQNIEPTMNKDQFMQVMIFGKGNTFEVRFYTGKATLLGTLRDPDNTFPIGAVGVAARDSEQNEIDQFLVCPQTCPQ